jgi:hypothetical protein
MPYATITHLPDQTVQEAEAVVTALEPAPDGLLAAVIGQADNDLWIIDVWASQAHHDRFVTERLHPALHRAGRRIGDSMTHLAVDIHWLYLSENFDSGDSAASTSNAPTLVPSVRSETLPPNRPAG